MGPLPPPPLLGLVVAAGWLVRDDVGDKVALGLNNDNDDDDDAAFPTVYQIASNQDTH